MVEVKNYRGQIEGKEEERFWKQHKVGRKGTRYSQEFYSPTKQVGTHVYRLSKMLKQENIYTWVQGVVYFVNDDVKIDSVQSLQVPVLSAETPFSTFLNELHVSQVLPEEKIKEIVTILDTRYQKGKGA